MPKLYIANATVQAHDFHYRLPEVKASRKQLIAPGAQIQISGDLSMDAINAITRSHEKYGMVKADEIDRSRGFINTIFSMQPIPLSKIKQAFEWNMGVLTKRGEHQRKMAGIAVHNQVAGNEMNQRAGFSALEIEIKEQTRDGRNADSLPTIAEATRYDRNANDGERVEGGAAKANNKTRRARKPKAS